MTTYAGHAETLELLAAGAHHYGMVVTTTERGWIECRVDPQRQLNPNAKLDFVRLVQEDEGYWKLYHLTHNEIVRGEATFSHSLIGSMYAVVHGIFECM